MSLSFEWDSTKAAANRKKHGVTFAEASTVFADPLSLTIPDPDHSDDEDRLILLGSSEDHRLLVVVFTERKDHIRLISSARPRHPPRKEEL